MDLQNGLASRNDVEYLQTQMKNVYATQAEHADRLMRLEQRQDSDTRLKSVWGQQSPFPGSVNGTPHHDPSYNPAAEAFKNFDQDQPSNMLGSLHLDTDDEPRRGAASRANSVRFDESALHGHFGQGSRSSTEFFPMRPGSAFGSHPMTERSSSHKSDGRQSSAGQSNHSARASVIGLESRPLSATVPSFIPSGLPLGPPPGLFILGPVPSIIRCWLDTNFSNESLLYAAVCTGSYKSSIDISLLARLGYEDQITTNREGQRVIRLPVYLPEATIQQSSSRSSSPAPQLPTLTTDFAVEEIHCETDMIRIFLGCDVLRLRNADIHFSLDRLTLLDDERNKLSVPLVRPENAALFQNLRTTITNVTGNQSSDSKPSSQISDIATSNGVPREPDVEPILSKERPLPEDAKPQGSIPTARTVTPSSPLVIGRERKAPGNRTTASPAPSDSKPTTAPSETEPLTNGTTPDTPTTPGSNIWTSWRRDSTQGSRPDITTTTSSGYQRAGRGRGMKVLKPARLNTSRSSSTQQAPVGFDAAPSRFGDSGRRSEGKDENSSPAGERKFSVGEKVGVGKAMGASGIGNAFPWLNSGKGASGA